MCARHECTCGKIWLVQVIAASSGKSSAADLHSVSFSNSENSRSPQRGAVCVCVNLPGTWEQRVTPFVLHTTSLQGDGRVARGAPSTEALPALTFVHFACQFVLLVRHSFASDVARGRNLTPDGSSHLVLHAILDVWHVWHKNFHPIFVHHHPHPPPHSPRSRFGSCPLPNLSV